jgi:hypothetical protein
MRQSPAAALETPPTGSPTTSGKEVSVEWHIRGDAAAGCTRERRWVVLTDAQTIAAAGAVWFAMTAAISALFLAWKGSVEKSEQRAWELVTALRAEAAESNKVLDKLTESVRELREAIREGQRR